MEDGSGERNLSAICHPSHQHIHSCIRFVIFGNLGGRWCETTASFVEMLRRRRVDFVEKIVDDGQLRLVSSHFVSSGTLDRLNC